jgi:hypothetical protein
MSISKPATRAEFKEFIKRQLGHPVIQINVDDNQIEDAVEIALAYFIDYHFDGSELIHRKHQITSDDITNSYIDLPETIIGVTNVWRISSSTMSSGIFNPTYQFLLNEMPTLYRESFVPYYMYKLQIQELQDLLVGDFPIRYNKLIDRLHLDVDVDKLVVGDYLIMTVYEGIDPETNTNIWSERMFQKHATALLKKTWGAVMSKFEGVQLPGGITLSGREIYNDAISEIDQIENEYRDLVLPARDIIA